MDLDLLYKQLKARYDKAVYASADWRIMADACYNLYNGNHLEDEYYANFCDRGPGLILNKVKPFIDSVLGLEANNKRVFKFVPRQVGKSNIDERITAIADWFRQESNGSAVDSKVFKDCVICGIGWLDIGIDYEGSVEGRPYYRRLDPFSMYWDSECDGSDLRNIKYAFYKTKVPLSELKKNFPHSFDDSGYDEDYGLEDTYKDLIECRYKKSCKMVRLTDPITNEIRELQYKHYLKILRDGGDDKSDIDSRYNVVIFYKELVHQVFMYKDRLLDKPEIINLPYGTLGWVGLPAFYDNRRNMYYGLVKNILPVQKAANILINSILETAGKSDRGGYIVEKRVIPTAGDEDQFLKTINSSDHVTFVNDGGLSGIQPKRGAELDTTKLTLFNLLSSSFNSIMGISEEFLGIKDVNQPGVLEEHLKQSSLNILGHIFDNLSLYRKEQGRLVLHYIRNELSDGRLIQIINGDNPEFIKLESNVINNADYEIIIGDTQLYLNTRDKVQNAIREVLPLLSPYMNEDLVVKLLDYSNLPSEFVSEVRSIIMNKPSQPDPMQLQQMQLNQAKAAAELDNLRADAVKKESLSGLHTAQAMALRQETAAKAKDAELWTSINNAVTNGNIYEI